MSADASEVQSMHVISYIAYELDQWLGHAAWIALGAVLAVPFILAFLVSRPLMRRLVNGNREISAGFSSSGASGLLAVIGGQLFYYAVLVLALAPAKSLG